MLVFCLANDFEVVIWLRLRMGVSVLWIMLWIG